MTHSQEVMYVMSSRMNRNDAFTGSNVCHEFTDEQEQLCSGRTVYCGFMDEQVQCSS